MNFDNDKTSQPVLEIPTSCSVNNQAMIDNPSTFGKLFNSFFCYILLINDLPLYTDKATPDLYANDTTYIIQQSQF